ncbi:nicotinamidase-related amidase [Streptomyces sp. 1114.5]|uniref:cysteine hydrolase family protein n=1 Tax=Streptomyces sp. 1114.5 TaxID=1938830 RepID=UPI000EB39AF8|nr:cysteine hydrolase [Streptomyces sp. 1114.5]RKT08697.1 nicotinamidase-related amidase [Streptomyces sp. 1114.5]
MNATSALAPARTALLVLDCQPAVLAALPDDTRRDALLDRVETALAHARTAGATVVFVRTAFTEADWDAVPGANATFAAVAHHRALHHQDPAAALHPRLVPRGGDLLIRKTRHSALSGTGLDRRLREHGITALVVCGLSTSGAVLSTVTDAADRDYRLHLLSDAIADPNPHAHDPLLHTALPARAHLLHSTALPTLLPGTGPATP